MKAPPNIICDSCSHENPLYRLNCEACNAYLRERVVNIDLWSSIGEMLDTPVSAFRRLIFAEHKNYIVFITLFISLKLFFHSLFLKHFLLGDNFKFNSFTYSAVIVSLLFCLYFIVIAATKTFLFRVSKIKIRYRDIYTLIVYSFIPLVFSFFILAPVEYAIFGKYWFTFNPSPFFVKEGAAYVISGVEGALLLWSFVLLWFSNYTVTRRKILSLFILVIEAAIFSTVIFYLPFI